MVTGFSDRRQNLVLAAMPAAVHKRLDRFLKLTPMPLGHALYESGKPLEDVFFLVTSIVSMVYAMEDGRSAEIALVGNEGILGVALFLGGKTMPHRAIVQSAGHAYSLSSAVLLREFGRSGKLQHLLLRYTQALLTQMAQTAVCNRHHTVD
jgi:CRP-like cAMP-binding protein